MVYALGYVIKQFLKSIGFLCILFNELQNSENTLLMMTERVQIRIQHADKTLRAHIDKN